MFFKRIPLAYDLLLLFSTSEACLALTPLGLKMFNVRRNTSGLDLDRARAFSDAGRAFGPKICQTAGFFGPIQINL